jgi:hypothetical protein
MRRNQNPEVGHEVRRKPDVGEEVEEHHDDAAHHQAGKHDVDVLGLDPLHEELTHAVPGEHHLDDEDAAQDRGNIDRHHRHQWGQGVAQGMKDRHPPPRQALGPGHAEVVAAEHIEHGGALEARPAGVRGQRDRDRR